MFVYISLLWIHIIATILLFILGSKVSKFIEPIITENIITEIYDIRTAIYIGILIFISYILMILSTLKNVIPSIDFLKSLVESDLWLSRISYLIFHSVGIFSLPIIYKFLQNKYKYKIFIYIEFIFIMAQVIHFFVFLTFFGFVIFTS